MTPIKLPMSEGMQSQEQILRVRHGILEVIEHTYIHNADIYPTPAWDGDVIVARYKLEPLP